MDHPRTFDRLLDSVTSYPREKPACVIGREEYTYGQLTDAARNLGAHLQRIGVRPGDRVAVWLPNSFEWLATMLAVGSIGALLVPINARFREEEATYVMRQSGSKVLVARSSFGSVNFRDAVVGWSSSHREDKERNTAGRSESLEHVIWVGEDAPAGAHPWSEAVSGAGSNLQEVSLRDKDPVLIQYTSGTTSFPKGALLTHYGLLHNAYVVGERMHIGPDDRVFCGGPFFHIGGVTMQVLLSLIYEVPFFTLERFDPAEVCAMVADYRCTTYSGIESLFLIAYNHESFSKDSFASVRTGWMTGSPETVRLVREDMDIEDILCIYGTSETSPNAAICDIDDPLEKRLSSCGRAHPGCELAIADPDTAEFLSPGERGEIVTRGYNVMLGYYGKPEETAEVFFGDGWLRTGDMGSMDDEGYLHFHGRYKEIIRVGGENFSPEEVEGILYDHPAVEQVALIGLPDETYGEVPVAVVKTRPGHTLDVREVREFLDGRVAGFKVPREVRTVESFPMTESGKVQKFRLKEWLSSARSHG